MVCPLRHRGSEAEGCLEMRYTTVTYEYIGALAKNIRSIYKENRIIINPSSSLEESLRAAEILAKSWKNKNRTIMADHENFYKILSLSMICLYLGEAIKWAQNKNGLKNKLIKLLHDTLDPSERKVSEARNFAFELYMASKFESKGINTFFLEPDIHFHLLSKEFVLACKHPVSLRNISKLIEKGKKQVVKTNFKGFIGLAIDQLAERPSGVLVRDKIDWLCYAECQFLRIKLRHENRIIRKLKESKVIGLIVSLNNPIISIEDKQPILGQQLWVWPISSPKSIDYKIARKLADVLN